LHALPSSWDSAARRSRYWCASLHSILTHPSVDNDTMDNSLLFVLIVILVIIAIVAVARRI
jgi:hypothetical protein